MAFKDSFEGLRSRLGPLAVALAIGSAGLATALATSGGGGSPAPPLAPASGDGDTGPASHVSFLQKLIPPPAQKVGGPAAPRSVADLARRLPLERAVAQLFLFGFQGKDATAPVFDELRRLDLGGVVIEARNYDSAQQLAGLASKVGAAAAHAAHIAPWVMAAQDGGEFSQFADLPPAHPPGDFHTARGAASAMSEAVAALKALGINGLFEPDLDLGGAGDTPGILGRQALSGDPALVADYAGQTVAACLARKMFCAAKHFPGIGAASTPTDEGPAQIGLSMAALERNDVVPFAASIKAGIPGIVVGEGLYEPDSFVTPAALSKSIIGGLLRGKLHFGGLAITDDLADPGVSSVAQIPDAAVQALQAGADMIYISGEMGDQEAAYNAVLNAVRSGQVSEARVRQALLRVLLTKRGYALLR
jgi:beta-N-acetylhexosaminidase